MKALSAKAADGTPLEFEIIALGRLEARPSWVPKVVQLPAVRLRYRVTGERRQAGPLRARHFDADAVRSTNKIFNDGFKMLCC